MGLTLFPEPKRLLSLFYIFFFLFWGFPREASGVVVCSPPREREESKKFPICQRLPFWKQIQPRDFAERGASTGKVFPASLTSAAPTRGPLDCTPFSLTSFSPSLIPGSCHVCFMRYRPVSSPHVHLCHHETHKLTSETLYSDLPTEIRSEFGSPSASLARPLPTNFGKYLDHFLHSWSLSGG